MKLSFEDKMKMVKMSENGISFKLIAKKFNISKTIVKRNLKLYWRYGEEALRRKQSNTSYPPELKLEIVKKSMAGETKNSLALEYRIGTSQLIKWRRDYEEYGYNGLVNKKTGRPRMNQKEDKSAGGAANPGLSTPLTDDERMELVRLREDYKKLKKEKELSDMENELLKKLDALVRERLKREGRK